MEAKAMSAFVQDFLDGKAKRILVSQPGSWSITVERFFKDFLLLPASTLSSPPSPFLVILLPLPTSC